MKHHLPTDASHAFAELGRIDFAEHDLEAVLDRVCRFVQAAIPGAAEVSVSLLRCGQSSTAAFTGELALKLDERQYEVGSGPCVEAAATGMTLKVDDMSSEERWPAYSKVAAAEGACSTLSVGMPFQHALTGAINIYARDAHAFDDTSVEVAETFAGYAAVAVTNVHLYESTATLASQMQEAMDSRAVIEQAKGILVAQRGGTPEDAFTLLSMASQHRNKKLRDIAAAIVERAAHARPTK